MPAMEEWSKFLMRAAIRGKFINVSAVNMLGTLSDDYVNNAQRLMETTQHSAGIALGLLEANHS